MPANGPAPLPQGTQNAIPNTKRTQAHSPKDTCFRCYSTPSSSTATWEDAGVHTIFFTWRERATLQSKGQTQKGTQTWWSWTTWQLREMHSRFLQLTLENGKQRWQNGAVVSDEILFGKINQLLSWKQIRDNQLCGRQPMFSLRSKFTGSCRRHMG